MGLGTWELLAITFVILLLFGGKKLPGLGRSMGNAITNFKKGLNETPKDEKESKDKDNDSTAS